MISCGQYTSVLLAFMGKIRTHQQVIVNLIGAGHAILNVFAYSDIFVCTRTGTTYTRLQQAFEADPETRKYCISDFLNMTV